MGYESTYTHTSTVKKDNWWRHVHVYTCGCVCMCVHTCAWRDTQWHKYKDIPKISVVELKMHVRCRVSIQSTLRFYIPLPTSSFCCPPATPTQSWVTCYQMCPKFVNRQLKKAGSLLSPRFFKTGLWILRIIIEQKKKKTACRIKTKA